MYKRHAYKLSILERPEMFGFLPLDPSNDDECSENDGGVIKIGLVQ